MASPFKSATRLTSKWISPRIARYERALTPVKSQNINIVKSPSKRINLAPEDCLTLDSPHTKSLLNNGLDQQDLLYFIGKGTFGTVLKSKYKGTTVAAKLIKLQDSSDPVNEKNVYHLVHENIINILDIIVSRKYGLIIMEYHEDSKNLQQVLDESTVLNETTILNYSRNIARGIKFCHTNGVMHLDIKPKNILVCGTVCKICDFGNSLAISHSDQNFKYQGTVAYTAPELLKGHKPTPKCDIYSLGMLMWQLISGQNPYEFLESEVIIYKVVKFDFRPVFTSGNQNLCSLCKNCWERNPESRPSAAQICDVLDSM